MQECFATVSAPNSRRDGKRDEVLSRKVTYSVDRAMS